MTTLAIPEPSQIEVAAARDLAESVVVWSESCDDVEQLEDARAKCAAIETYLRRKSDDAAREMAKADRHLEIRIGDLLGKAKPGPPESSFAIEDSISKDHRHQFRQMAQHKDVPEVADAVDKGESRSEVLRRIKAHKRSQAERKLSDEIDEWADTIPEPTDPEGDKHRSLVWGALMAARDGSRQLAKFTPDEVTDAIASHPFAHVQPQMAADLIEAVDTTAAYTEVADAWR